MSTLLRGSERVGKLHSFRLADIPVEIRQKYAHLVSARLVQHELGTKHGVHNTPEEAVDVLTESIRTFHAFVVAPSNTVYRVSQKAWDEMLVEAKKLERRDG